MYQVAICFWLLTLCVCFTIFIDAYSVYMSVWASKTSGTKLYHVVMCRYIIVNQYTKQMFRKLALLHPVCAQRKWIISAEGIITVSFQIFRGFSYALPHTIRIGFSAKHILKYFFGLLTLKCIFKRQGKCWYGYFAPTNVPNFS